MKIQKFIISAALMIAASLVFFACGDAATTTQNAVDSATETVTETAETATEAAKDAMIKMTTDGPEYTSAYVCPMHCAGSGSAEAGKCPVCGMDYVANETPAATEADGHEGHNH